MDLYKYANRLIQSQDAAFDATHTPGTSARAQGFTATHPVETRLLSQAATHFRLKTIGSTVLPTARSGGGLWFIQCSRAGDKSGVSVPFRLKAGACRPWSNSGFGRAQFEFASC